MEQINSLQDARVLLDYEQLKLNRCIIEFLLSSIFLRAAALTNTREEVIRYHFSPPKNQNSPTLGPSLSQIPNGGEGNTGQMPHICPTPLTPSSRA